MSKNTIIWIVIVIIVLAIGGALIYAVQGSPSSSEENNEGAMMEEGTPTPSVTPDSSTTGGTSMMEESSSSAADTKGSVAVTLTANGFEPASVTIKKGQTVTWTDTAGDGKMWVASAQHPTHTAYSGTTLKEHCPDTSNDAFDQCASGNTYSFTFDKAGTWKYHNHVNASQYGTVVVTE